MTKIIELNPPTQKLGPLDEKLEQVLRAQGYRESLTKEICDYARDLYSRLPPPHEMNLSINLPDGLTEEQTAQVNAGIQVAFGSYWCRAHDAKMKYVMSLVNERLKKLLNPQC